MPSHTPYCLKMTPNHKKTALKCPSTTPKCLQLPLKHVILPSNALQSDLKGKVYILELVGSRGVFGWEGGATRNFALGRHLGM